MSGVSCPQCQASNPAGSKFCNSCGAQLPTGTSHICPNCKTSNPIHLFYCDHCGSRLVRHSLPAEQEEPPEESDAHSGEQGAGKQRPFSLPSRPPGDTGDLDPAALPDWLHTGEATPASTEEASSEDEPEPSFPEKEPAADDAERVLDDWLSELEDVDVDEETEGIDFADWLSDLESEAEEDEAEEAGDEADDEPDWLADRGPEAEETLVVEADSLPEAGDEADDEPDWLAGRGPEAEETLVVETDSLPEAGDEADEVPDWLADLGLEAEEAAAAEADSLPEAGDEADEAPWLADLDSEAEEVAAVEADTFPDSDAADDEPDWLADLGLEAEEAAAAEADSLPEAGDEADEASWLADLDSEAEEAAAVEADTFPDSDAADDEPDWLADLGLEAEEAAAAEADSLPESDETDDEADWLTDFDPEAEEAAEDDDDDLPDWLMKMAPKGTGILSSDHVTGSLDADAAPDSDDELDLPMTDDLPGWLFEVTEAAEAAKPPTPAEEPDLPESPEPPETPPEPEAVEEEDDTALIADWLSGIEQEEWPPLEEFDPSELVEESPAEPEEETPTPTGELKGVPEQLAGDDLPDWLTALEDEDPFAEDDDLFQEDDPFDQDAPLEMDSPFDEDDSFAEDALFDEAFDDDIEETITPSFDQLPDWLQPPDQAGVSDFDAALTAALSDPEESSPGSGPVESEWEAILGETPSADEMAALPELPPASQFEPPPTPAEELADAEIPGWLQALKPRELTDGDEQPEEEPLQTSGPLSGIRGVIDIEPAVAQPQEAGRLPQFAVTKDQRQQVALLRQLIHESPREAVSVAHKRPAPLSPWLRLGLAGLLFLAVLLGLLLPWSGIELVNAPPPLMAETVQSRQVIAAAANQPVLVAFDYTPALAAELDPQARLILEQLARQNSQVILVSQYAAGVALSQRMAGQATDLDVIQLGLLPGEGAGLRRLAVCVQMGEACQTIFGQPLSNEVAAALSTTAAIVLLTGERDSLVNWIEQVGATGDTPLIAGVTQALAPVTGPYLRAAQLDGAIGGLPAAAAYEQLQADQDGRLTDLYHAQALAQWLVILLLIIGAFWYGIRHLVS